MVMAAALPVIVVMVVLFFGLLGFQPLQLHLCQISSQGCLALHSRDQLLTGELIPRRCHHRGNAVVLPKQIDRRIQLGLGDGVGTGQDDGGSGLHLVVVEFTEILHIDLYLAGIRNGNGISQGHVLPGDTVHSADHIGKLTHAGGLDQDPVRGIFPNDPFQRLTKIAHQRAADAAGVHFRNVDPRVLQKAAVYTDFAELILDKHQLLALVGLGDHLLNEGRFARAEKTGINIYFCHNLHLLFRMILFVLYHFLSTVTREDLCKIQGPLCVKYRSPSQKIRLCGKVVSAALPTVFFLSTDSP